MPKNLIEDPSCWGADVSGLVNILNKIDIPLKFKEELQAEVEHITGKLESGTYARWGRNV